MALSGMERHQDSGEPPRPNFLSESQQHHQQSMSLEAAMLMTEVEVDLTFPLEKRGHHLMLLESTVWLFLL